MQKYGAISELLWGNNTEDDTRRQSKKTGHGKTVNFNGSSGSFAVLRAPASQLSGRESELVNKAGASTDSPAGGRGRGRGTDQRVNVGSESSMSPRREKLVAQALREMVDCLSTYQLPSWRKNKAN